MLNARQERASMISPAPRPAWMPVFEWADLLHLAIALWLIYKQRLALHLMAIPPGPSNMLASAGAILFLTAWIRRASGRKQIALWLLLSGLATLLLYADIVYYRQFGDLVSIASLRQAHQLTSVSDSVAVLVKPADLWLFADMPALGLMLLLPRAQRTRWFAPVRRWFIRGIAAIGLLVVGGVAVADPFVGLKWYGHTMVGSRLGLLNYHAFDIGAYAERALVRLAPQTRALREVEGWAAETRLKETPGARPPGLPGSLAGIAKGKNVIMLQVESLQSFPIGMKVDGREVTPNLNRLLNESLYFPNFYHQTGQGVTSDADLLANCSLYPTRTGAVYYDYADNDFRCMPSVLRAEGYAAVAMQGMPADFWNLSAVYPRVGFERYLSIRDFEYDEKVGISLSDESFLRQAVAKLRELPQPYYAFLVTLTSHGPFEFDNLPVTFPAGEAVGTKAGHYLNAIHYTDRAIGRFLDRLKAESILDDALLVVYGDHQGVGRNDEGLEQLLHIPKLDEVGWAQAEKRVPLFIRLPGAAAVGVQEQPAGQVDIAPTVAGLLGISTENAFFMGRDLLATDRGSVPFYRGSAVDETHLFLSPDDSAGAGVCYQLKSRTEVDLAACDPLRKDAEKRLRVSRLIVERNLIPLLRKSQ